MHATALRYIKMTKTSWNIAERIAGRTEVQAEACAQFYIGSKIRQKLGGSLFLLPEPPIGTQKCVPLFFCPISKKCARLGVFEKKVSGVLWLPIVISTILSPKAG